MWKLHSNFAVSESKSLSSVKILAKLYPHPKFHENEYNLFEQITSQTVDGK